MTTIRVARYNSISDGIFFFIHNAECWFNPFTGNLSISSGIHYVDLKKL